MSNYILINGTLYHHGIQGQKWGLRRWQNEDGSLTPAGREHYGYGQAREKYKQQRKMAKNAYKLRDKTIQDNYFKKLEKIEKPYKRGQKLSDADYKKERELDDATNKAWSDSKKQYKEDLKKAKEEYRNSEEYKQAKDKAKKIAIAGAAITATALAAYGGYKLYKLKTERANTILEGRKVYAKVITDSNRQLYSQLSGYYQGDGKSDKFAPVNRLSDEYTKDLRKNMLRYQKNITEGAKAYNEADKALRSSNWNKIKTAHKIAKENTKYNNYDDILNTYNDYIKSDKKTRSLYKSDDLADKYYRRKKNSK